MAGALQEGASTGSGGGASSFFARRGPKGPGTRASHRSTSPPSATLYNRS